MEFFNDFHLLRPYWLLLMPACFYLCYRLWKEKKSSTGLETYIDKALLKHLTSGKNQSISSLPFIALALISIVLTLALSGPTGQKRPQPVFESESAVVIILDLSPSMLAEDVKPSRIIRAHLKIQDLLSQRKEGVTALIVYGGEAHVVTPMTDDSRTISNLLPTLKPGILPIPGSNVEMAISLADEIVRASGLPKASLLLMTDDINKDALTAIQKNLSQSMDLTILGVGTEAGAPIPHKGDFLSDKAGNIVIAKRDSATLESLALKVGGYYLPIQNDTSDIEFFIQHLEQQYSQKKEETDKGQGYDTWYELGPTLLLLVLPIIALLFRRGLLLPVFVISVSISALTPQQAFASLWGDLWKNQDQRGLKAWQEKDYDKAAKEFSDSQWQGSAQYKTGDYEAALKHFEDDQTAIGDYNRGNALAQLQRYEEAISAYEQALKKQPQFPEAEKNKAIVEKIKQQQDQQKNQQEKNEKDNNEKNKEKNDSSEEQSNSDESSNNEEQQGNGENNVTEKSKEENKQDLNHKQENNNKESEKNEQNQQSAQDEKAGSEEKPIPAPEISAAEEKLSKEEQQALQQWLRKVPDDPSGLLKRKFEYEFQKRRELYQQGDWELPKNNAHKRY
ncbi:MAG: VWA domain-containing protein [Cellvibrionaceae bacterium]